MYVDACFACLRSTAILIQDWERKTEQISTVPLVMIDEVNDSVLEASINQSCRYTVLLAMMAVLMEIFSCDPKSNSSSTLGLDNTLKVCRCLTRDLIYTKYQVQVPGTSIRKKRVRVAF